MIKINQEKLRDLMKLHDWTQRDLAKALDFSESYITLLLNGEREPSREFMARLISVSGLTLGDLFFCPDNYQNVSHRKHLILKGKGYARTGQKVATKANLARNPRGKLAPLRPV